MRFLKRTLPYILIAALIVGVSIVLTLKTPVFVQFLESKTFDMRFLVRGGEDPGTEVVIVAIDDYSLEKVGRWPWSRVKMASLIGTISKSGAKTIGLDILFSEPQVTASLETIKDIKSAYGAESQAKTAFKNYLKRKEAEQDVDAKFASTIERAGNVVLPFSLNVPTLHEDSGTAEIEDILYNYIFMVVQAGNYNVPIVADKALLPLEQFIRASWSLGHVYTQYDRDGAIRWEPLYLRYGDMYFPSFGVEVARHYLGLERYDLPLITGEGISFGDEFIATDAYGRTLINYNGKVGTFTTYSAFDVMEGGVDGDAFRDKIVLIGTTALATTDIHITPFAQLPGVEKVANVVENILHNRFLSRAENATLLSIGFIIAMGVVMSLCLSQIKAILGAVLSFVLLIGYIAAAQYIFSKNGVWVDLLIPSSTIVLLYSSITGYRFLTEENKSREIRSIFSSYVTKRVVDEILKNPDMAKLGGARKEVTVLFSDIRGFTTYSENRDPEEVVAMLNEYLAEMTEIVFKWDGTLDKFVGDEIMAFWGAPLEQTNHAETAVRCSLHMMRRLAELQEKWVEEGKEPLDIGVGLNTGDVLVGNIGAEGKKMDYTIIGDHVNLGARVEALTRQYDAHIIITEFTYDQIKHLLVSENNPLAEHDLRGARLGKVGLTGLDTVKVKGKDHAVSIYAIKSLSH